MSIGLRRNRTRKQNMRHTFCGRDRRNIIVMIRFPDANPAPSPTPSRDTLAAPLTPQGVLAGGRVR